MRLKRIYCGADHSNNRSDVVTNPASPEVDWPGVFSVIEMIKKYYVTSTPNEGALQALKAIRFRLDDTSPIVVNYTLTLLNTCYKNCDRPFQVQVASSDNLKHLQKFLETTTLAAENRGQCLEMIADWANTSDIPEMKRFFETLVRAGYRFSVQALAKISPEDLERLRPTHLVYPQQGTVLVVPNAYAPALPLGTRIVYAAPQIVQTPLVQSRPDITSVSEEERRKWVAHDCSLVENTVSMLVETVSFAEPGVDITTNEIAVESYNRCLDIQRRIVGHIEKVQESDLLDKLITSNSAIVAALELYNNHNARPVAGTNTGVLIDVSDSVQVPPSSPPIAAATAIPTNAENSNSKPIAAPLAPVNSSRSGANQAKSEDPFADQ
ncbi:hypothetical protein BDR26DRAFT_893554 [Obelidium mucronatum]|nr:hypothetical protein BDR26DRAFT_893554 [Obelidium mucronatum]